jgi:hypothetical protein
MPRPLRGFLSFLPVLGIVGLFVLFTFETANPLQRVEKEILAAGRVVPDAKLRQRGPLESYVALYPGRPGRERPLYAIDDALAEPDGSFALRADENDGKRLYVYVRVETADFATFCTIRPLPPARVVHGRWALAAGGPVPRLRLPVAASSPCNG